jgi:tRNA (guanine37-N1)-methyltransferase
VARLLPGVIGNPESLAEESHSGDGLLEYPVYTKPPSWRGYDVPEVLLSGNHGLIADWRHEESVRRTAERRPDLLAAWGDAVTTSQVKVLPATLADAGEIHTLQLASFLSEGQIYDDLTIPPLTETLATTVARMQRGTVLKAVAGTRIVGTVQLTVDGSVGHVERLCVAGYCRSRRRSRRPRSRRTSWTRVRRVIAI